MSSFPDVKYPEITVRLSGENGNSFNIMGIVTRAMRMERIDKAEIDAYRDAAMSGDYDHLMQVTMKLVNVE